MLRTPDFGGVSRKSIVALAFLVRTVQRRIVDIRLEDSRLEVVQQDTLWNPTEELESSDVAIYPGRNIL
jgi:hypothetical protein